MNKADKAKQAEHREELLGMLKPGDTLFTVIKSVSRSGMFRRMDVYRLVDNDRVWLTGCVASVIEARYSTDDWRKEAGMGLSGCGMDMGFEAIYRLSSALYPNGFDCVGERCPSNDHSNGDRDYKSNHHHRDGGYAINQRWL